jgi:predicted ester cyclase
MLTLLLFSPRVLFFPCPSTSTSARYNSDPNPSPGVDAYLEGVLSLRDALSTIVIVVDDLVAQGLKVVAQLSFKASAGG